MYLRLGNFPVGIARTSTSGDDNLSLTASLKLNKGERVSMYKGTSAPPGSDAPLFDSDFHHTHFTGWLVEEEL